MERNLEINEEDLPTIIEEYVRQNMDFDFDDIETVNNRPVNIWLYALCRTYIDSDDPDHNQALRGAEIGITGDYDANPSWTLRYGPTVCTTQGLDRTWSLSGSV